MVSDDLDDLRCCDRVIVMFRGAIVREFTAGWAEADVIGAMEGWELSAALTVQAAATAAAATTRGARWRRLRDLTLIPVIIVLLIIGALRRSGVPDARRTSSTCCSSRPSYRWSCSAEAMILISGKFDLSLESTVGLAPAAGGADRHRRARHARCRRSWRSR